MSSVLSFIWDLSLVINKPLAENTRSASTEVGGIVSKAECISLIVSVSCCFPEQNKLISLANVSTSCFFWTLDFSKNSLSSLVRFCEVSGSTTVRSGSGCSSE